MTNHSMGYMRENLGAIIVSLRDALTRGSMSRIDGWISVIGEATGQYGGIGSKKYGVEKDRGCFELSDRWIDK